MSDAFAFSALLFFGACVSLDERGLFATTLTSPIVAGLGAGLLVRDLTGGLAFGVLFHALFPVRVESGGQVPPSAGLASIGAVAFLWAAGVSLDSALQSNGLGSGSLASGAGDRLSGALAPWPALSFLALAIGILGAEVGRRWERRLRSRNGEREGRILAGMEEVSPAEAWGNRDPLSAIRRAQVLALGESAGRGAGIVVFAIAVGWPLRDAPFLETSARPLARAWLGLLLAAPLLGAAFLVRDLPLGRRASGERAQSTQRTLGVVPWIGPAWRMWIVTLLGFGAGALAVGWIG